MAPVMLGRGSAARVGLLMIYAMVLVGVMCGAHATQYTVGDADHWAYIHANDSLNFYQNWATNKTFLTGDTLLFEYDNQSHSVLQVDTLADFTACNLQTFVAQWTTGLDNVFISRAGTYYYACGSPSHCQQGMKFFITATGSYVALTPGSSNGTSPIVQSPNHSSAPGALRQLYSGAVSLILAVLVAATLAGCV